MSESHKTAFFAQRVLLVEGPSDEIIVAGLAVAIEHSLLGGNTQCQSARNIDPLSASNIDPSYRRSALGLPGAGRGCIG